jgi:L-lactate dehydrogenase complex protein LldG
VGRPEEELSARAQLLGRIRSALGVTGEEIARNAAIDDRLRRTPRGVIPARGQLGPEARVALFARMAEAAFASVARLARAGDVPEAIADYLRSHNLPAAVRSGGDLRLTVLPWQRTALAMTWGATEGNDPVGLSHAVGGVAETGTVVLASGPDNPTTLAFLPETHIVVVRAADIAGDYETAWTMVRARYGKGQMPRTVNWITGPSRSADIEQTLLLGAHGPQRLHLIVVG